MDLKDSWKQKLFLQNLVKLELDGLRKKERTAQIIKIRNESRGITTKSTEFKMVISEYYEWW